MVLRDAAELRWGQLTWTITAGALARLLGRARLAHAALTQRLDCALGDLLPDLEIPDSEVSRERIGAGPRRPQTSP
jgi:hypothetical protein